jgi:fucose permease
MRQHVGLSVVLCYAAFVLVGVSAAVSGVLLPAQIGDYQVSRATIGLAFFTSAAGFFVASLSTGGLIHRFGVRVTLAVGGGSYVLAGFYLASRPPLAAFLLAQLVTGYATGILESALNAYLAELPDATRRLNRLHAFFGVGALTGPVLAAWLLGFARWTAVWLVLAVAAVPLTAGFLLAYPGRRPEAPRGPATADEPAPAEGSLLAAALRQPGVLLGATMLAVYVGVELSVGNWGFSYLVQARGLASQLAGYSISGYWLGLTLGRFLISPAATRIGMSTASMMYACLAGTVATVTLAWVLPAAGLASVALLLLGFFLGPIFPTTIATVPLLTPARLRPTAIGILNAASVVGGAGLPWLAGALAQRTGIWAILPFTLVLALLQFAVWRPLANRLPMAAGRRAVR